MLTERRELLEQEIIKQKQACGQMYRAIVLDRSADYNQVKMYDGMKAKLSDLMADLAIVEQMIADGHE